MADNDELNSEGVELETDINKLLESPKSSIVDKIKLDDSSIVKIRDTETLELLSRLFNQTLGAKDGLGTGCVAFESRTDYDKVKDKYKNRDKLILIADDHIEIKREDREDWNPIGTILPYMGVTAPNGYLMCNGQEVAIASFPDLYAVIGALEECQSENEGMFKLPDLREVALVGAGQSTRIKIAEHDVYALGEFKDDQIQQHRHELAVRVNKTGVEHGYPYSGLGASNTAMQDTSYSYNGTFGTVKSYMRNIDGRAGSTTHGKQIGVNYIIKWR